MSPELPVSKTPNLNNTSKTKQMVTCPNCDAELQVNDDAKTALCWSCSTKFIVSKSCCDATIFLAPNEVTTYKCVKCSKTMRYLPCCRRLTLEQKVADGRFQCASCKRVCITCTCGRVNPLPKVTMSQNCLTGLANVK